MFEIIPAIDVLEGKVVRLLKGDYEKVTVYASDPLKVAQRIKDRGYNWIHLVNLEGARSGGVDGIVGLVEKVKSVGVSVEVGGGIRTQEDVSALIERGADRIVIGTMAFKDEEFLSWALDYAGEDKVVVGMDVKGNRVAIKGWTEVSEFDVYSALDYLKDLGVRWILCTDVSRDGTQEGPNLDLYETICTAFPGRVIASGGVGGWEDIDRVRDLAKRLTNLSGLVVGRFFYETGLFSLPE